jgi:hypothetical protein
MTPIERVLSAFPDAKRNGKGWHARCPAHDDRHPSLSIVEGDDGRVLVHCHAGCTPQAIVKAVNLNMADLMPPKVGPPPQKKTPAGRPRRKTSTPTVYTTANDAITELERKYGQGSAIWRYDDAEGQLVGVVVRWDKPDGRKDIRPVSRIPGADGGWIIGGMPAPRPLYQLPDLLKAPAGSRIYITEGEKAADAARDVDLIATTSAHGSKSAAKTDWSPMAGHEVVILPDADDAGERYVDDVVGLLAKLTPTPTIKVVRLPDLPFGDGDDIADFVVIRGGDAQAIKAEVEALADNAEAVVPASPLRNHAPRLIRMSDVEPADIRWLWPGRIPLGRLTLLVGRPGDGKSFLTAYLAANVSRGRDWIDGSTCPRGSVVLCSAEDDPADTIAPRLIAHDTDRQHVHLLAGVMSREDGGEEVERVFTLADLSTLRQTLEKLTDCKLIVVDPIGSYLGGRTDAHRDNEVRSVLAPVCHLAAQFDAAVVVVAHTRKAVAPNADDMVMGSRAFTALARSVLHLMIDPDDQTKHRRLLLPGKNNLVEQPAGLCFDIGPGDVDGRPCVRWIDGEITITANEAMSRGSHHEGKNRTELDEATDWLRQTLADGPLRATEVKELAKEVEGIAPRTLDRAKKVARVETYRLENPGPWYWRTPNARAERQASKSEDVGALAFCPDDSAKAVFTPCPGAERQDAGVWRSAHEDDDWGKI